jgi:hypothetical protein
MTERTIEHIARELAGTFYDTVRSAESKDEKVQIRQRGRLLLQIDPKLFAKTFPTVKDYLSGTRHGQVQRAWQTGVTTHLDDGKIYQDYPGWMYWYDQARQIAVEMLSSSQIHENLKQAIMDALIEDREKELKREADGGIPNNIPQRHNMGPLN